ncbi:LOB domain-containing protein 11 [Cryptomeria japonica]|uniref:LOB domain-containing protein 11 n=1 Tax=Cryptomeria japonica TaxID=3369 RepID=UPI0027DA6F0D|nr:LOB domain-containing protein 11 [Cryptomeria japonica]
MEQKTRDMPRIVYPCAACKIQRRKCGDKCALAPYFPPSDLHKFIVVHKLFGTSNIVKTLQEIPAEKRADAVNSMAYEASERVRDPVYGCTGKICRLHKQVLHLQSQLAIAQAELLNTHANLMSLLTGICNAGEESSTSDVVQQSDPIEDDLIVWQDDDEDPFGLWEPL